VSREDQRKLVLFGAGPFASLAWYSLANDSAYDVAGFTVDARFLDQEALHGLPVVAFEDVEARFDPAAHDMLLPVSSRRMNTLRMERFEQAKAKGYRIASYVSSRALAWPDLVVRENVVVFEGAIIQPFASIGGDTIIRSGVHVSHHVEVGEHCFLAPRACLGGGVSLGPRCFVGLNATVRDRVSVAEGCLIAAGAVVTADTAPDGLYVGVPARRSSKSAMDASPS
jgi:sugar O-acyltransferase (sialic acid O-acetyltransferase NeuD family)